MDIEIFSAYLFARLVLVPQDPAIMILIVALQLEGWGGEAGPAGS